MLRALPLPESPFCGHAVGEPLGLWNVPETDARDYTLSAPVFGAVTYVYKGRGKRCPPEKKKKV